MIWLLTRVMTSSTTWPPVDGGAGMAVCGAAGVAVGAAACAAARAAKHTKGIRTRQSFFIGSVGPPRFLGLRAKSGLRPIGYFTPSERARVPPLDWTLEGGGKLAAGQSGGPH